MAKKKDTRTNIEVTGISDYVNKDEGGFFVYLRVKGGPVAYSGIKFYVEEEFEPHVKSLYREEE